jgi:uncharacterized protein with HEPN domain
VRRVDRFISRLRDIQLYGERAKNTVRDRSLVDMEPVELDALCYLVLIVSEATIQALGLDEELAQRHPEIPWHEIRATGNRLRHGYATIDLQVVHQVVERVTSISNWSLRGQNQVALVHLIPLDTGSG